MDDENVSDEPSFSFDPQTIVESAFEPKANVPSNFSLSQSNRPRKPHFHAAPTKVVSKHYPKVPQSNLLKSKSEGVQMQ